MASNDQVQLYKCSECDKIYCSRNGLFKHRKQHHSAPVVDPTVGGTPKGQTPFRFHALNDGQSNVVTNQPNMQVVADHPKKLESLHVSDNLSNYPGLFEDMTPTRDEIVYAGTPWSDILSDVCVPCASSLTPDMRNIVVKETPPLEDTEIQKMNSAVSRRETAQSLYQQLYPDEIPNLNPTLFKTPRPVTPIAMPDVDVAPAGACKLESPPRKRMTITKTKEVEVTLLPMMGHGQISQMVNAITVHLKEEAFGSKEFRQADLFQWCRRSFVNVREDILWLASSMACEAMATMADALLNESVKMLVKPEKERSHPLILPYDVVTKVQAMVRKD